MQRFVMLNGKRFKVSERVWKMYTEIREIPYTERVKDFYLNLFRKI